MVVGTNTLEIVIAERKVLACVCCAFRTRDDQVVGFALVNFKSYFFSRSLQDEKLLQVKTMSSA